MSGDRWAFRLRVLRARASCSRRPSTRGNPLDSVGNQTGSRLFIFLETEISTRPETSATRIAAARCRSWRRASPAQPQVGVCACRRCGTEVATQ
jgi:hypothetical protein